MLFIAFVCGFLGITSADPFKEDLVYPELLQERSESGELLLRIQDTTLHLKKSSVLAHDLFLDTSDGDESEYTLWNGTSLEENLYHDSEHQSSIMLHQDDGAVKVEGMLSPSWRIAPLSSIERSEDAAVPHRIYRIADTDHRNDLAFRDLTINIPVFRKRGQKKFDRVPPRQKLPKENSFPTWPVMMNAINIWYEGMTEPKIRTKIVGVSRCKTSSNDVKWPRDSDAVYVFTGQNMGDVDRTGKPKGNLLGIARKSSLCTELNVGMGEDTPGTFRGAHIAAHEIAHILGSSHDGGVGDPLIQKQGGDLCSWEDGYLMSYKDGGRKKYQLSRCSKSQIRRLLSTVSDKCLEETSQLSMRTQRNILPGQIITAEDYCRGILASKGRGVPLLLPKDLSKCRMQCCLQPPYGGGILSKRICSQWNAMCTWKDLQERRLRATISWNHDL
ncbi:hypothetical protein MTO96_014738 [Rhipicephalus appendiculatus]